MRIETKILSVSSVDFLLQSSYLRIHNAKRNDEHNIKSDTGGLELLPQSVCNCSHIYECLRIKCTQLSPYLNYYHVSPNNNNNNSSRCECVNVQDYRNTTIEHRSNIYDVPVCQIWWWWFWPNSVICVLQHMSSWCSRCRFNFCCFVVKVITEYDTTPTV